MSYTQDFGWSLCLLQNFQSLALAYVEAQEQDAK